MKKLYSYTYGWRLVGVYTLLIVIALLNLYMCSGATCGLGIFYLGSPWIQFIGAPTSESTLIFFVATLPVFVVLNMILLYIIGAIVESKVKQK